VERHRPRAPGAGGRRHGRHHAVRRATEAIRTAHSFTEEQLGWFKAVRRSTRSNRRRDHHDSARGRAQMPGKVKVPAATRSRSSTASSSCRTIPSSVHRGRWHRPRHLARGRPRAGRRGRPDLPRQSARSRGWRPTAGEKARRVYGAECPPNLLPPETLDVIRGRLVAIKGPLTTPVGEGFRSLNVTLRQELDPVRLPPARSVLRRRAVAVKHPRRSTW